MDEFSSEKSLFVKKHEKYLIFTIGNMYDLFRKMCFFVKIFEKSQFSPLEIWINFCQKMNIFLVKKKSDSFHPHLRGMMKMKKKRFFGNYLKSAEFENRNFPDIWEEGGRFLQHEVCLNCGENEIAKICGRLRVKAWYVDSEDEEETVSECESDVEISWICSSDYQFHHTL